MSVQLDLPQYFFDDTWIAANRHVTRRWLPAVVAPEPSVRPEHPWESFEIVLYGTVVERPEGGYWMYYRSRDPNRRHLLLLATSGDGLRWEKPNLGLVEWQGSKANNIVLGHGRISDSASVVNDPEDTAYPWKMLTSEQVPDVGWGLIGYRSADGLHWDEIAGIRLRSDDRTNLMARREEGKFVVYTRHPRMYEFGRGRMVHRSESSDFMEWTPPELAVAADLHDEAPVEIYGMSAFRRNGWYFGLVEYWHARPDMIETYLAVSRDGKTWHRPLPRAPFIASTHNWNRSWTTCASNGPIIIDNQMVFYFGGRWDAHGGAWPSWKGVIGYATLPVDRFCAIEGSYGSIDTPPFAWPGGDVALNVDCRECFRSHPADPSGEIQVEVLDAEGAPLAGWSGDDHAIVKGNTHRSAPYPAVWPGGRSLDGLRGRTIRLRFHLLRARLFTFAACSVPERLGTPKIVKPNAFFG